MHFMCVHQSDKNRPKMRFMSKTENQFHYNCYFCIQFILNTKNRSFFVSTFKEQYKRRGA